MLAFRFQMYFRKSFNIMKFIAILFGLSFIMTVKSFPQKNISPVTYTYKVKDTIHLDLHIYYPKKMKRNATIPAVIFFFGGGWANGNTGQFMSHSKFLAENGIAGITAEYRIKNIHGTTPQDAISDAKSAMRWLKSNAEGIQIDKNRIVAAGGSAGGYLAACTATLEGFNDPSDDTSIDPTPAGLILFNPVVNTMGFKERFGGEQEVRKTSPIFRNHTPYANLSWH